MDEITVIKELIAKLLEVELLLSQVKSTQQYTMATKVRKLIVDARYLKCDYNTEHSKQSP